MTKSREAIWDLLRAQASRPYKSTGTHLLLINCSTTSSEATLFLFYLSYFLMSPRYAPETLSFITLLKLTDA